MAARDRTTPERAEVSADEAGVVPRGNRDTISRLDTQCFEARGGPRGQRFELGEAHRDLAIDDRGRVRAQLGVTQQSRDQIHGPRVCQVRRPTVCGIAVRNSRSRAQVFPLVRR